MSPLNEVEEVKKQYVDSIIPLIKTEELKIQEFEKDEDQNFHVDFIWALSNLRARNYKLEEMDWINVKLKAG